MILEQNQTEAREKLHIELCKMSQTEPQFCQAILDYLPRLNYTAEQWFNLLLRIPNQLLFRDPILIRKLTPEHRTRLGIDL